MVRMLITTYLDNEEWERTKNGIANELQGNYCILVIENIGFKCLFHWLLVMSVIRQVTLCISFFLNQEYRAMGPEQWYSSRVFALSGKKEKILGSRSQLNMKIPLFWRPFSCVIFI